MQNKIGCDNQNVRVLASPEITAHFTFAQLHLSPSSGGFAVDIGLVHANTTCIANSALHMYALCVAAVRVSRGIHAVSGDKAHSPSSAYSYLLPLYVKLLSVFNQQSAKEKQMNEGVADILCQMNVCCFFGFDSKQFLHGDAANAKCGNH